MGSRWAKMASRWPKMASRWPQDGLTWLSGGNLGPTWAQVSSELRQDEPDLAPSWLKLGLSWARDRLSEGPGGSPGGLWGLPEAKRPSKPLQIPIFDRFLVDFWWFLDLFWDVFGLFFSLCFGIKSCSCWRLNLGFSSKSLGFSTETLGFSSQKLGFSSEKISWALALRAWPSALRLGFNCRSALTICASEIADILNFSSEIENLQQAFEII